MRQEVCLALGLMALGLCSSGCQAPTGAETEADADPVYDPTYLTLEAPPGFPTLVLPEENPTTEEGIALGRMLYYDTQLDGVSDRACAQCHHQSTSFTSSNAVGILPHVNLGWATTFLWDGLISGSLEDIMTFEVEHFFETDVNTLAADPVYPEMFFAAFGSTEVTTEHAAYALAQFQRTLVSADSPYDRYFQGAYTLTEAEARGMTVFYTEKGDCFHCHATRLFTDNLFHNNGLDLVPERLGLADVTGLDADVGKFKTATLRNIALTAPYMHDDRFATLEDVVDFYSEGLVISDTIDPLMKGAPNGGVQLSEDEKSDLVAFLKTLTDSTFITNSALSDPTSASN